MRNKQFLKDEMKRAQLPKPPYSLMELLADEPGFEMTDSTQDMEQWEMEINTNQDHLTIQWDIYDDYEEYRIKLEQDLSRSGRFTSGSQYYTRDEVSAVRKILEIFDKHGYCGNQYNEYWEI